MRGHERGEQRLQRVAKLVTGKPCKPMPIRPCGIHRGKGTRNLVRMMRHDMPGGLREQAGRTVWSMVEANVQVTSFRAIGVSFRLYTA